MSIFKTRGSVESLMNADHYGKAMCANDPNKGVTITTECCSCGTLVVGPVHPFHLRSLATMLNKMAEMLGIPETDETQQRIIKEISPRTPEEFAEAEENFRRMSVTKDIAEGFVKDPWGLKRRR